MSTTKTLAPLDPAALAKTLAPFGESRMLRPRPTRRPKFFEWERANFFAGWHCVGRSADISAAGMQRADQVGDTTVLFVRGEDLGPAGIRECLPTPWA